jgi:uncharacterized protein (TIGR02145 family)
MAENLNYEAEGSRCFKDNPANCAKYGRLYNWETAAAICPEGWRLPSNEDWDTLMSNVETGGSIYYTQMTGKYLKAASGWKDLYEQKGNGEDKYGFAALPGGWGYFDSDDEFYNIEFAGSWWSSSEIYSSYGEYGRANNIKMNSYSESANWESSDKGYLYSVRCVQGSSQHSGSLSSGGRGNDMANYKTVKIGEQTWMAENLEYVTESSRCYEDKPANCAKYGRLYDMETALTVCPSGWHLPSDEDWEILIGGDADIAGKYLKAENGWADNGNGEDKYGFAALPSGWGYSYGKFYDVGESGIWWTQSSSVTMDSYSDYAYLGYPNNALFSVRCVQDISQQQGGSL